jgi:hypothetical protein
MWQSICSANNTASSNLFPVAAVAPAPNAAALPVPHTSRAKLAAANAGRKASVTDKPFKPASPMKASCGEGTTIGTFGGAISHEPVRAAVPHMACSDSGTAACVPKGLHGCCVGARCSTADNAAAPTATAWRRCMQPFCAHDCARLGCECRQRLLLWHGLHRRRLGRHASRRGVFPSSHEACCWVAAPRRAAMGSIKPP